MILENQVIITEDEKEYLVIETVEYKNRTFAYLVNGSNNLDTMFVEIEDNGNSMKTIVPEFFEGIIYPLFNKKIIENTNK